MEIKVLVALLCFCILVQQQFVQQQAIVLAVATALQRGNNSQIFGVILSFILSQCGVRMRQKRRLWQQARLPGLWLEMKRIWPRLPQGMEDEKYYCHYRMHKAAFDKLLSLVAGRLESAGAGRKSIEPRRKLAVTLYWVATGSMYHVVGSNYGIHKSTVYLHINQTINTLHDAMLHDYIRFPMGLELSRVFYDFEYICKLPQVAGVVDGCFIPMMKPPGPWGFRYWCYKNLQEFRS